MQNERQHHKKVWSFDECSKLATSILHANYSNVRRQYTKKAISEAKRRQTHARRSHLESELCGDDTVSCRKQKFPCNLARMLRSFSSLRMRESSVYEVEASVAF